MSVRAKPAVVILGVECDLGLIQQALSELR